MKEGKYARLVMVTELNNNKWYEMSWDGRSPSFSVKYGRVESSEQTTSYPISKWNSKYNEKVNKGYKDVTELLSVEVTEDKKVDTVLGKIDDSKVEEFLSLMKRYTDNLVSKTYSVKSENVTEKQVDEAQKLIDEISLTDRRKITEINKKLIELYMVIPRYMGNVRDHILPSIDLDRTLIQEQDNLDAMSSQVKMNRKSVKQVKEDKKQAKTLLDVLGLKMKECHSNADVKYLTDQIAKSGAKLHAIFKVDKLAENESFTKWMKKQENKNTKILIHGTRCTSVVPILKTNLQIRPSGNYQFSGKAYGDGNYFSEVVQKSLGYTGYDKDIVLLVYEVHTGKPYVYDGWYKGNSFPLNYKELKKRGYDSTHVNAGNGLLNSEIIAYNEDQNRIKYILWLKR